MKKLIVAIGVMVALVAIWRIDSRIPQLVIGHNDSFELARMKVLWIGYKETPVVDGEYYEYYFIDGTTMTFNRSRAAGDFIFFDDGHGGSGSFALKPSKR